MPDDRYDWLYDGDETSQQTADLPPPDLPPPGGSGGSNASGESPKGRRRRPWRTFRRIVAVFLVAALGFYVAVGLVAWSNVTRVDATSSGESLPDQPGTTFLLVGSDKRPGDKSRGRTDTILLLHHGSGPTVLTSLPRDSQVDIPGHGRTKINAAYAHGGAPLLVETIELNTGVKVDGYVEVGFQGLVDVVDALGGIEVCPERDLKDADSHLDIKAGCQVVDGETALAYSRNRKSFDTGDIARGQNQREVISAIGAETRSWRTLLPPRYVDLTGAGSDALAIGEDVSLWRFIRFAWVLSGAMSGDGLSCTVPIRDFAVNWDTERATEFFGHIANDTTDRLGDLCTLDGRPA